VLKKLRPSPALVVALLALSVAIGGSAYAAAWANGSTVTNRSNTRAAAAMTVSTVFYAPRKNASTPKTILHLGGLVLTATCSNGDVEVIMTSTADHAHLSSEMWNSAGNGSPDGLHHSDFGPNSATHLDSLGDGNAYGETSFTYTRANGTIVSGQLSFDSSDLNPLHPGDGDIFNQTAKCLVSGFVTSSIAG
jgi:hypothetical protein